MHYHYPTRMVCARSVDFDLEDECVRGVRFTGGCDGNLRAVSKLVEGMPAEQVIEVLAGNPCNGRDTSCADQLTRALADALARERAALAED